MGGNIIDGIEKITYGISDTAYRLATGKTKRIRLDELISGHGSVPNVNGNSASVWGYGFAPGSSGTASSRY